MNLKYFLRLSSMLALTVTLPYLAIARPQDGKGEPRSSQPAAAPVAERTSSGDEAGRKGNSGETVDQLKTKVEQLQVLVEQQQRAIAEMQRNIEAITSKTATLIPAAASSSTSGSRVIPPLAGSEAAQTTKSDSPSPPAQSEALAGWGKNHAFLRSADGSFETQLTGYAQLDYRGYQSGIHPPNTFLVRRARLSLEGKLDRYFEFKVEGDFADTASTLLRDFYLDIHRADDFRFRFGQFKEPFSQEELRSDANQDFVERSLVNNLAPSRSPGLMLHGIFNKDRSGEFEYQLGTFNGKGLLTSNNNNTPESVLRLRFSPWKEKYGSLAFGGAYAQGRSLGGTSVRGRTESQSVIFYAPNTVNGKIIRANGELTWLYKSASIRAEYAQTNQSRDNLGPGGRNLPGVVAKGYMAQATYLLTRENKPDGLKADDAVVPKCNLFSKESNCHWHGAWELKFRYANLQIADSTARSNRAETFYFGPNWYMNRFVKYVLDVGFERFKDPLRSPNPGDKNYFVVLSRIQLAF